MWNRAVVRHFHQLRCFLQGSHISWYGKAEGLSSPDARHFALCTLNPFLSSLVFWEIHKWMEDTAGLCLFISRRLPFSCFYFVSIFRSCKKKSRNKSRWKWRCYNWVMEHRSLSFQHASFIIQPNTDISSAFNAFKYCQMFLLTNIPKGPM